MQQGWSKYVKYSLSMNGEFLLQRTENQIVIQVDCSKLISNGVSWKNTGGTGIALKEADSMRWADIVRTAGQYRQHLYLEPVQ